MARRGGQRQTVGKSLKTLFVELSFIAIVLSIVYFVAQVMEMKAVEQYVDMFNITRNATGYIQFDDGYESDVSTDIAGMRSGYTTAKTVISLGLSLLGLVMVMLVFAGYLIPVVQSIF